MKYRLLTQISILSDDYPFLEIYTRTKPVDYWDRSDGYKYYGTISSVELKEIMDRARADGCQIVCKYEDRELNS